MNLALGQSSSIYHFPDHELLNEFNFYSQIGNYEKKIDTHQNFLKIFIYGLSEWDALSQQTENMNCRPIAIWTTT